MNPNIAEINKELALAAPLLATLPKVQIDQVPNGYFDHVEHQILAQMSFASILSKNKEEAPAGYFESLETETYHRLEMVKDTKVIQLVPDKNSRLRRMFSIAASVAAVVCCVYFLAPSSVEDEAQLATSTEDMYIDYLTENIDEFDINTLIEHDLLDEALLDGLSFIDEDINIEDLHILESEINF